MLSPCYSAPISNPEPFSNVSPFPSPPLSVDQELSIAVTKVINAFEDHEAGYPDSSQLEFQLKRQEYWEVLNYLEQNHSLKGWVDCKLHYNYDPTAELLEIRMPTRTHEILTVRIADEIKRSIHQFSTQCVLPSALPAFLDVIENLSSSDIFSPDDPDHKRCPDASFSHPDDQYPGIVIETSYSQRARNVEKGADEYIMISNGNIKMVICFDVEYRPNNQQVDTVSLWRPMHGQDQEGLFLRTECILDREPFRDATTKIPINPNHALTIPLNAFADTATLLANSIPLTDHATTIVTISFLTLANHVTAAQEWDIRRRNLAGRIAPTIVGERKRRRSSTPPEIMTREDERAWRQKERLSEKKAEQEDESWEE
ncbi:MAG: hypothetical protein M1840_008370 [Geoglossum simile]|nr:MAG: hypothetical protein M1840_008370 [Geoglossum simile]